MGYLNVDLKRRIGQALIGLRQVEPYPMGRPEIRFTKKGCPSRATLLNLKL